MPPKTKKGSIQVQQAMINKAEILDEKENKCSNILLKETKNKKSPVEITLKEKQLKTLDKSYVTSNMKAKIHGFWSKKLQDLEENETKNKKCGLYEFSETDSSFKIKKKQKPRARVQRKRQPPVVKYNVLIERDKKFLGLEKVKPLHKAALAKENITVTKEKEKLRDKAKKFAHVNHTESFGITSTPAVNKKNLIGASDFQFLSPISMGETVKYDNILESSPNKTKIKGNCIVNLEPETPKIETKLKSMSCRRVLRSGKVTGARS